MIVTLTANPSLDRTVQLPAALEHGGVNRIATVTSQAGGKGLNVAWVLAAAGMEATAVLPVGPGPLGEALTAMTEGAGALHAGANTGVAGAGTGTPGAGAVRPARSLMRVRRTEVRGVTRVNTAITEPDGTTTKLNEAGAALTSQELEVIEAALLEQASRPEGSWVVLSGSLPPGAPVDWYAYLVRALRSRAPQVRIAVDTSDAALEALAQAWPEAAPDLLKPNGYELGQLTGLGQEKAWALEQDVAAGDHTGVIDALARLRASGVGQVLASLGAAGAVLATPEGTWHASAPQVRVRSTVGAGDSCLAGYLLGQVRGDGPGRCLASAVAYGSAAASLPGTALPGPGDLSEVMRMDGLVTGRPGVRELPVVTRLA